MAMPAHDRWLWTAIVLGPSAWFLDLTASWAITPPAYRAGDRGPLYVVTAVCLAIALASTGIALWQLRAPSDEGAPSRDRWLRVSALAFGLIGVLLVVGTALPKLLLAPGAEP
jgi:hypothetical protein